MISAQLPRRPTALIGVFLLLIILSTWFYQSAVGVSQPQLTGLLVLFVLGLAPRLIILSVGGPLILFSLLLGLFLQRYIETHGTPLGDTYVAIIQSEFSEIFTYLSNTITVGDILLSFGQAALLTILAIGIRVQIDQLRAQLTSNVYYLTMGYSIAMIGVVMFGTGFTSEVLHAKQLIGKSYASFLAERENQQKLRRDLGGVLWQGEKLASDFNGTFILLLGESTTRHHLGLYGYPRDTTPRLDQLADDLLIHTDTISPHSHTVESVSEMLSSANYDDAIKFHDRPDENIIAALQSAGFKSFWFSNQNRYGIYENLISVLGENADESVFIRKSFGKVYSFKAYDHQLLPLLEAALHEEAKKKFITLHMYATHWTYCSRLPEADQRRLAFEKLGRAFFGMAKDNSVITNCYDNAVRYVDRVVGEVLARAKAQNGPVVVVYLADHGEDPLTLTGHESSQHRHWHVEIPHIWYFNPAAKKVFAEKIEIFRENLNEPFKSSDFFHTALDLLTHAHSGEVRSSRSLFSKSYTAYPRTTVVRDKDQGMVRYDDTSRGDNKDDFEVSQANLRLLQKADPAHWEKLWAHRVDTIGKLLEAKQIFAGVELDVVYDNKADRFFVHHPPAANSGLTLEYYLRAAADRASLSFWLDWKKPRAGDVKRALRRLDLLDGQFAFKGRAVVELASDFTMSDSTVLRQSGWRFSYYLPTKIIVNCAVGKSEGCSRLAMELADHANDLAATYVSFDHRAWPYIRTHQNVFTGFDWLSWDLAVNTVENDFTQYAFDDRIDAMLVVFPSPFNY